MASFEKPDTFRCSKCTRIFATRATEEQHRRDKHVHQPIKVGESFHIAEHQEEHVCNICNKSFGSDGAIYNHNWSKHNVRNRDKIHRCLICPRYFVHREAVRQHTRDKHMHSAIPLVRESLDPTTSEPQLVMETTSKKKRTKGKHKIRKPVSATHHLINYLKTSIEVRKQEAMIAFKYVFNKVQQILSNVNMQEGGNIFCTVLRKAGSNATGTKINKADEFDFNITLNVKVKELIQNGTVPYTFQEKEEGRKENSPNPKNMNVKRDLIAIGKSYNIPSDYAVVVVDTGSSQSMDGLCRGKHLIPHLLQQRLYSCIAKALEGETDIDLNREAHGPAITMTFKPEFGHHINVDITMVIDWPNITVGNYGWPRQETRKALFPLLIKKIQDSGCQLTPKGDEFWNISFSNCESILMKEIDHPGECRKTCHKLLKGYFQTWRSRSITGYRSISSFIFKHLTFWMNEKYHEPGFWNEEHLSERFIDTLKELRSHLNSKYLPNYFGTEENILGIRDQEELRELSVMVGNEICNLDKLSLSNNKF